MKRVVSVSLGSSNGDFAADVAMGGETIQIRREGMNGEMARACTRIRELDGEVDAIGLGGIDIYLYVGGKQFVIGDGIRLAECATRTPVVDGSGLKNTLERTVVEELGRQQLISQGMGVLMVSAMDRFGMAEALVALGCDCVFGDLIFNLGIDYPIRSLDEVAEIAERYRSRLLTAPFHLLYPTGSNQEAPKAEERFAQYYEQADVIAGDRHLIHKHLPAKVPGKGIITNTTRPSTIRAFREAGIRLTFTTTPVMNGVSPGTNLLEAAMVAAMQRRPQEISTEDYVEWIQKLGLRGSLQWL